MGHGDISTRVESFPTWSKVRVGVTRVCCGVGNGVVEVFLGRSGVLLMAFMKICPVTFSFLAWPCHKQLGQGKGMGGISEVSAASNPAAFPKLCSLFITGMSVPFVVPSKEAETQPGLGPGQASRDKRL